jgi:hypothetical protein
LLYNLTINLISNPLSSDDDSSEEDNKSSEDSLNSSSIMSTTSKSTKAKSTAATKKGKTTTELEDSPPAKRSKATKPPPSYSINTTKPYTVNDYPADDHDVIDLVLHEGGCPTANAQPNVNLQSDGMSVAVAWKIPCALLSDEQAKALQIPRGSTRYQAYNNTMQAMSRDGVRSIDGSYYIGEPQIIPLGVKCVGVPVVRRHTYPVGYWKTSDGKRHKQFNSMYVIQLRVDNVRVGLARQVEEGGEASFGFCGSQDSAGSEGQGGGRNGGGGGVARANRKRGTGRKRNDVSSEEEEEGSDIDG